MLKMKEGIINEIVYNSTVYNNGMSRLYPTLEELSLLFDTMRDAKMTTDYLRVTPFYTNSKLNIQYEFEDDMLYLECRNSIVESDIYEHIASCFGIKQLDSHQRKIGEILFPLCNKEDIYSFGKSLERYLLYLDEMVPEMMEKMIQKYEISVKHLGYGHFSFEVHSG